MNQKRTYVTFLIKHADPLFMYYALIEFESISQQRCGNSGDRGGAVDRVMNQLLTKTDTISAKNNVFIIGITNRSDIIDMTLMRPGRLYQFIYIPILYYDSRLSILRTTFRKSVLCREIDLSYLAA